MRENALKELEMEEEANIKYINVLPVPGDNKKNNTQTKKRNNLAEIDEEEEEKIVIKNLKDDLYKDDVERDLNEAEDIEP